MRQAADRGEAFFGTIDTWVIWNLTGGVDGGVHVTDVTNASRTLLMDLRTRDWSDELLRLFGVPRSDAPSHPPLVVARHLRPHAARRPGGAEVPVCGDLGDQQAATVGQVCLSPGEAKNTYGTGNFMLLNTGREIVPSKAGLLTTPCYSTAEETVFALEGSIAVTGSAVQWLRDQIGVIRTAAEIEPLAASVPDTGGIYFVPAFSGLFAPYWRADARGAIVGLSRFNTSAHLARATLEAICFQTRAVLDAMDAGFGRDAGRAQGGRRRDREQPSDAAAGRHPGRAGGSTRSSRKRPRSGPRILPGLRWACGRGWPTCARTGHGSAVGAGLDGGSPGSCVPRLVEGGGAQPELDRMRKGFT